jgi:hypothetical protein
LTKTKDTIYHNKSLYIKKHKSNTMKQSLKVLKIPEDTHSNLMQYKAKEKLKSAGKAIDKLLDSSEWQA